jgi:predicted dinucleotide-binding enzyme
MSRIGIIGAGHIGSTAAKLFVDAGHEVVIANSRGPESLADLIASLGGRARAMSKDEAASWGEVVLLAVPFRKPEAIPSPGTVAGKIVVDARNAYEENGAVMDLGGSTSSEETCRQLPDGRIVKAFNTIWFKHLAERGNKQLPMADRHAIFVASDFSVPMGIVMQLIEDIGFGPVGSGSLVDGGRLQQPGGPLYNKVLTQREARALVDTLQERGRAST